MKAPLTEIIFLLDRSGSMTGLENDTIGGFNSFVNSQCEIGETLITTVLFDDKYEILHSGLNAKDVHLTKKDYFTRGSTALLDAVGRAILEVGMRLCKVAEGKRPDKVIFVITTDGAENSSREFTYEHINNMIEHQKKTYGWEFIFLGANIDVAKESMKLGIDENLAFGYEATKEGTAAMYSLADTLLREIRTDKPRKSES